MRLTVWEPLTEQGSGHAAVGHTFKRVMSATRPRLRGPGALLGPSRNIGWELWGLAERGEGGHGFGASPPPVCAHFSKLHPRRHWHWSVFDIHTDGNNVVASHGQNVAPALQVPLTTSSGPRQGVCGLSLYRHTQQLSRSTETPPRPPRTTPPARTSYRWLSATRATWTTTSFSSGPCNTEGRAGRTCEQTRSPPAAVSVRRHVDRLRAARYHGRHALAVRGHPALLALHRCSSI